MGAEIKLAPVDPADVYEDAEDPRVGPGWWVRTRSDVEFALRRLGELEREKAGHVEAAATEIQRIENKRDALTARTDRGVAYFSARLRLYLETNRAELIRGDRKSAQFLYGSLGYRKPKLKLEVKDEAAFLAWCKSIGAVKVEETPKLDEAKKHIKTTGEVPEGAVVVEGQDEFYAKGEK